MRKNLIWKLIGLVISVSVAVILLAEIDLDSFMRMVRSVPVWSLTGALVIYLLLNFFRYLRFRALLAGTGFPFSIMYPIVLYHNLLVRVLPFKTGEVSYVVLLRQYLNQPLRDGVSSLVLARLFELLMVVLAASTSLLLTGSMALDGEVAIQREVALPLLFAGMVVFVALLYYAGTLLHLALRIVQRITFGRGRLEPLAAALNTRVAPLAASFDRVRQPRTFFTTLILSVFTYSMSVSFNVILLRGIGVNIDMALLLGIISIVMLAEALPLATISGFGMIEGGWALGLVGFAGFDVGQAASIGFFLHGCQLVAAAASGLTGYLWLQANRTTKHQEIGINV